MQQITTLLWILGPLFIGFIIELKSPKALKTIGQAVNGSVYAILFLMGIGLAHLDNLGNQFVGIIGYAILFLIFTIGFNALAMGFFDRKKPWTQHQPNPHIGGTLSAFSGSLKQVSIVFIGLLAGFFIPVEQIEKYHLTQYLLMILVFLIGIQLRSSGVRLRTVLINRRGVQTATIFIIITLSAGALIGNLLSLPLSQSLAISSGFGWYSLSGSIMTQAYGSFWGAVALINDLGRELIALIFIPMMMRQHPSMAVSTGGATSLDFTLPIIHRTGGVNAVPLAISFSFIINILSPILMIFFANSHF